MSRLSRDKKRDQQWGATPIDVRVPLTGELPSTAMVAQAETATKAVKGVKEVHNNLTVKVGKS